MNSPTFISWFYVVALSFLVAAGRFDDELRSSINARSDASSRNERLEAPKDVLPLSSFQRNLRRNGPATSNISPKHHQFNRRLGPFISGGLTGSKRIPPRRPPPSTSGHPPRVHHHPYMEQPHPPRGRPNRRQHYTPVNGKPPFRQPRPPPPTTPPPRPIKQSWPVQNSYDLPPPPPPTIKDPFSEHFSDIATTSTTQLPRNTIKRKLLLPIISEGYASTNIQGGNRQNQRSDKNTIDGDEIALQVVASNDLDSYSKANDHKNGNIETGDKTKLGNNEEKKHVTVSVDLVAQATVSEIPKLLWSSTTTVSPTPETENTATSDTVPLLSESSPYFPVIPQVAQTEREDGGILTETNESNDKQDVALIIKDKLTDIFSGPELGGMYDETKDLLAAQQNDNNYFSVDLSASFGKPNNLPQNRIQTKITQPKKTPNKSQYVATVEEVPLFNAVDFSSSNTRRKNTPVSNSEISSTIEKKEASTTTTTTTTTTPSPFILQPGSPMLATSLEDATSITEDQLANVKDKDQYVRFVATPPKQINVHIPAIGSNEKVVEGTHSQSRHDGTHINNLDATGHYTPPATAPIPSNPFYQAGYHSDVPGDGAGAGQFPGSIDPSLVDPNIFHEDRPTLPQHLASSLSENKKPAKNIYPLGKAPPKNEDQLPVLLGKVGKGPAPRQKPKFEGTKLTVPSTPEVRKPKPKATSFLDFLIPSFLSGRGSSNRADPEGPTQPKHNKGKQSKNGLTTIKKLPVPTRPPNTFPDPQELGGRLNPILIKVPNGFPPQGPPPDFFPKPPSLEDWERHAQQQQHVLAARSGSQIAKRVDQENAVRSVNQIDQEAPNNAKMRDRLYAPDIPLPHNANIDNEESTVISNEIEAESVNAQNVLPVKSKRPILKLPVPPPPVANVPLQNKRMPPIHPPNQPLLQKTPLPMTSQPVIGLPRVPPGRKQAPFLMGPKQKPLRPPVVSPQKGHPHLARNQQVPIIPHTRAHQNTAMLKRNQNLPNKYSQPNSDYIKPTKFSQEENEKYLAKLKDPEFVQNLTRSYVFHHTGPASNENAEQNKNIVGQGPVSYVPQASIDPFFFRPKQALDNTHNNFKRNNQIVTKTNNKINLLTRHSGFQRHELPPLDSIAPPSRPVASKNIAIKNKPEVVYKARNRDNTNAYGDDTNPLSAYERRNTIYRRITTRIPITTTTTTTEPTFASEANTISDAVTEHSTVITSTTSNPIAEHISSLLKQYLSTDKQSTSNEGHGVPTLLYDDKQNTVILEYVAPDGEKKHKNDKLDESISSKKVSESSDSTLNKQSNTDNIARVDEGSDTLLVNKLPEVSESNNVVIEDVNQIQDILLNDEGFASYLVHLQEQKENVVGTGKTIQNDGLLKVHNAIPSTEVISPDINDETRLPENKETISSNEAISTLEGNVQDSKKTFQLDNVFQPSATPTESEWFILDENGRRRRKMSKSEIEEVKHIIEESAHTEGKSSNQESGHAESESNEDSKESLEPIKTTHSTILDQSSTLETTSRTEQSEVEMFGGFQPVVGPSISG